MEDSTMQSHGLAGAPVQDLSLPELARCCSCSTEWVIELVGEGVVEPMPAPGEGPAQWRFDEAAVVRVAAAWRLASDLSVNVAGVALALELLDEIRALRRQVKLHGPG
jgi:chaperone modulatory protein CbpM